MRPKSSVPVKPRRVRGGGLLARDTRELRRQKIARITLDSMREFVGLLDAQGTVLEINAVALDAAGIQLSEVEGKPFWTTFWWQVSKETRGTLKEAIARAAKGELVRWETEIYSAGGEETTIIDASLTPVRDEHGNVVFLAVEGRDISEKKAYEREIAQLREEMAKLDVLKVQLLSNISPEFRTPLTLGSIEDALVNTRGVLPGGAAGDLVIANIAPAILWSTGPNGSCSFVPAAWREYSGQSDEAAQGFGWMDAVHPEDRSEVTRILQEAARKREAFSLDCRVRRKDGEFRWTSVSGRPCFDRGGEFSGFTGSLVDIHERKRAALASSLLSAIVDSSDDAIISKDLNGVIMSWNKGAERLFGYHAEEAIGRSITMLIPPDRAEEEPKILERLKRGERVDHFETIRMCKDGSLVNISLTISPVKDAQGKIAGASKIARDITQRVRQEKALREANVALEQANADLQQFAHSASHDLQEPLRMVAAYSQLLQKKFAGKLGPLGEKYVGHTLEGAIRMEKLLRDLRTYMRVSEREPEPLEEIDCGAVLKKALLNLEAAIQESGASIETTDLPRVHMHEFQLEQIFQNLIGNGIRYRGPAAPRIRIAAVPEGADWLFSFADNGIGIEAEFREQVFGMFKRLHSSAKYPGTGMGLAICQRIVERSGGRIWVESEPGRGSTFYFTLPRSQSARKDCESGKVFHSSDRGQSSGCGLGV